MSNEIYNPTLDLIKCVIGAGVLGFVSYKLSKIPINQVAEKYYDANPPKFGNIYSALTQVFGTKRVIISAMTFTGAYFYGTRVIVPALENYVKSRNH